MRIRRECIVQNAVLNGTNATWRANTYALQVSSARLCIICFLVTVGVSLIGPFLDAEPVIRSPLRGDSSCATIRPLVLDRVHFSHPSARLILVWGIKNFLPYLNIVRIVGRAAVY